MTSASQQRRLQCACFRSPTSRSLVKVKQSLMMCLVTCTGIHFVVKLPTSRSYKQLFCVTRFQQTSVCLSTYNKNGSDRCGGGKTAVGKVMAQNNQMNSACAANMTNHAQKMGHGLPAIVLISTI